MPADVTARYFDSLKSTFFLNDGSVLRELTDSIKEVRGLPGNVKMNDITAFGSVGERPGPSIFINHFTVEMMFNRVTNIGGWVVVNAMYALKALRAFEYYPAGSGETAKIVGNAYLAVCEITSRVGDWITVHCEFHCDNGVTITP